MFSSDAAECPWNHENSIGPTHSRKHQNGPVWAGQFVHKRSPNPWRQNQWRHKDRAVGDQLGWATRGRPSLPVCKSKTTGFPMKFLSWRRVATPRFRVCTTQDLNLGERWMANLCGSLLPMITPKLFWDAFCWNGPPGSVDQSSACKSGGSSARRKKTSFCKVAQLIKPKPGSFENVKCHGWPQWLYEWIMNIL